MWPEKPYVCIQILVYNSSPPQVLLKLQGKDFLILKHQRGELSGADKAGCKGEGFICPQIYCNGEG